MILEGGFFHRFLRARGNSVAVCGSFVVLVFAVVFSSTSVALAQEIPAEFAAWAEEINQRLDAQQVNSNHIWTMTAAALVAMMQIGFLLLEAGMVRSKNSINVAQKNITDFLLATVVFYLAGFAIMFGPSVGGWIGSPGEFLAFREVEDWSYTFFVFQTVFVGTAATIVSGAVAERMKFSGYLIMAVVLALVIYPVFGHWAWGNLLIGDNAAWLADLGFIDFAGSTVVHSVGGWIGLAGIIVLGARLDRFNAEGKPNTIHGHSLVLSTAGALILLVGWIGFNGGSTTAGTPDFAKIIANTIIAAAFAGIAALIAGRVWDGLFQPTRSINGMLGGLVGITAGCDAVDPYGAIAIGMICGLGVIASEEVLLRKFKLDDVVGAVSVHGVCGALGTVLLAVFALEDKLAAASRFDQFLVQCAGVGTAFVWAMAIGLVVFKIIDLLIGLRVSEHEERTGLNTSEHGASLGSGELQKMLMDMVKGDANLSRRLHVEPGDETGELAFLFNSLLKKLEEEDDIKQKSATEQATYREIERETVQEISRIIEQARHGDLSDRMLASGKTGMLKTISEGINGLFDSVGDMVNDMRSALESMSRGELNEVRMGTATGDFAAIRTAYNETTRQTGRVIQTIRESSDLVNQSAATLEEANAAIKSQSEIQKQQLRQTADHISNVYQALSKTADNAEFALNSTNETSELSNRGVELGSDAQRKMDQIVASSKKALEVVDVIEEIAAQTNLLALNASVEAARAGDAGRGFAVVGLEVRRLATRVSEQSDHINKIITENQSLVSSGVKSVNEIQATLSRISEVAGAAAKVTSEISASAKNDQSFLSEAREMIEEVEKLMNSTLSETELASEVTSRLRGFVAGLEGAVSQFSIEGDDAGEVVLSAS